MSKKCKEIMLIGGSGRSGTTVLCRAMGQHPYVTDVPEWRFTTDPDGIVDFYTQSKYGVNTPFHQDLRFKRLKKLLNQVERRTWWQAVLGSARFRRLAMNLLNLNLSPAYSRTNACHYSPNFRSIKNRLLQETLRYTYSGFWVGMKLFDRSTMRVTTPAAIEVQEACAKFLLDVAEDVCVHQGATHHLEKNTWNILCFDKILELLPDAKLCHIVRDPRDVVASYGKQSWVPDDYEKSAMIYSEIMEEWGRIKKIVPRDSYIEVRLEDLVSDPENQYRRLCKFWGLEWSEEILQTKLSSSSFGRWKKDIPEEKLSIISEILKDVMSEYRYA